MHDNSKEIQCAFCDHQTVCSIKEQFLAAQQAVDNVYVHFENHQNKYLRNFDWIKRVKLECVHFAPKKLIRRDVSTEHKAVGVAAGMKFMEDPGFLTPLSSN